MLRRIAVIVLTLALAACNLSVPEVTPTLAPTRTPTPIPLSTNTPQPTVVVLAATATLTEPPTHSSTPTSTVTPTPSITPTPFPTITPVATDTNRPTVTPSHTPTRTPTSTATATNQPSPTASNTPAPTDSPQPSATNTPIPTVTPIPILPTDTATSTFTPTFTPSITIPPTLTPLPTLTNTPTRVVPPTPTPTRTLSADELTLIATLAFEPVGATVTTAPVEPQQAPTEPPATLDVTPTFITAEAPSIDQGIFTPISADTTPEGIADTPTPQPTVALIVTLPPIVTAMPPLPPVLVSPPNVETRAFALSTDGGISSTGFSLLDDTTLFMRNPVDPNLYVTTDGTGNLYVTGVNGAGAYRPDMSPFSEFYAPSREENDSYVSAVAWSPDGRYLSFIVAGRKVAKDGVWFFQPGQFPPIQLMVDCPSNGFPGCSITSNPTNPDLWQSMILRWSPQSDAILVNLQLPGEGRDGIIVLNVTSNERARDVRPPVYRYDFGTWSADGNRILVSGHGEDGHVFVGWINRDGSFSEIIYDAEANGLWMGFANPSRNGAIYALAAPGDRGGPREPLRIYNMSGVPLTEPIGEGYPQRVEWSPDGSAVFLQSNNRQYIANINGDVREITGQVAGARAVNWVDGGLPPGENISPSTDSSGIVPIGTTAVPSGEATAVPPIPLGVVEGSQYQPGQQLRVYSTQLNIRTSPGTAYPFARNFLETGEYVAILAGPVDADGAIWWQVQTADGIIGWVAGAIGGVATLGP
jgi:hypothetical protein